MMASVASAAPVAWFRMVVGTGGIGVGRVDVRSIGAGGGVIGAVGVGAVGAGTGHGGAGVPAAAVALSVKGGPPVLVGQYRIAGDVPVGRAQETGDIRPPGTAGCGCGCRRQHGRQCQCENTRFQPFHVIHAKRLFSVIDSCSAPPCPCQEEGKGL